MTARETNGLKRVNDGGPPRIGRVAANGGNRKGGGAALNLSSSDGEPPIEDGSHLISREQQRLQNSRRHKRTSSPVRRRSESPLVPKAMERRTAMTSSSPERSGRFLELLHMGLTFMLWLVGLAVIILGSLLVADQRISGLQSLRHFGPLQNAALLVIVIGALVVILGFIGCLAVNTRSRPLFFIFIFFLICLIILEAAACGLAWYYQKGTTVDRQLAELIERVIKQSSEGRVEYRRDEYDTKFNRNDLNFIEYSLQCCGAKGGIIDYTGMGRVVPLSCYNSDYFESGYYRYQGDPYNNIGCVDALQNFLFKHGLILGLLCLIALIIELALLFISASLALHSSSEKVTSKQMGPTERPQKYSPLPQQRQPQAEQLQQKMDMPQVYSPQYGVKPQEHRDIFHQTALSEDV